MQLEGSAGAQLAALKEQVFESGAFGRLLKAFTTVSMTGHHGEVRRMRPGGARSMCRGTGFWQMCVSSVHCWALILLT